MTEPIASTLLWLPEVPRLMYSAPHRAAKAEDVPSRVRWGAAHGQPAPFITRHRTLFAFHDLSAEDGPFAQAADVRSVECLDRDGFEASHELMSCYFELLNRALSAHLRVLGLRYDHGYARHYLAGRGPHRAIPADRLRWLVQKVQGEARSYWRHEAVALRFIRLAEGQWGITIRPELHLTLDRQTPARDRFAARHVTREKTSMGNRAYRERVEFWRTLVTRGAECCEIPIGGQRLVISGELLSGTELS